MRIKNFFDIIKNINIEKELDKRGIVSSKSNNDIMICCPYHSENSPSFGIAYRGRKKGLFRCMSGNCGRTGTFFHLISFLDKISLDNILKKYDVNLNPETLKGLKKYFKEKIFEQQQNKKNKLKKLPEDILNKFSELGKKELFYLIKKRRLKLNIIEKIGIKAGTEKNWNNRIIIPIRDEYGNLISLTARSIIPNIDRKNKIRKVKETDVKKILPGLFYIKNYVKKYKKVAVVEGEIDFIYLQQFGIPAICLGNTDIDSYQLNKMIKYFNHIVLILDGDVKPYFMRKKIDFLEKYFLLDIVKLPNEKDPNDLSKEEVLKIKNKYFKELVNS